MGAACCKQSLETTTATATQASRNVDARSGTLQALFERMDKDKTGYISTKNLQDMMRDDKTYFQGKDAAYIVSKYGTDGKLSFEQFQNWWGSTYTTYDQSDDNMNIGNLVDEVKAEQLQQRRPTSSMHTIEELADSLPADALQVPHHTNVAVSRS